jgi:4-hydroxy-tetrahydrodipicolinate synthase
LLTFNGAALALPPRYQLFAGRAEYAMQTPGLIVAPLTPFTSDLKVDEAGLARQIDYVVKDCRATMVVAAGVETQEYTYLSLAERKDLIRRTI